jgi:thiamine biosynthesis lipoprotein
MDRLELQIARRAMACDFSVLFPAGLRHAIAAGCAALDEVERIENLLSAYQEGSEICRVNREAQHGPVEVLPEVYSLLSVSSRLSAATGGAFDPATGSLVRAWGFFRGPRRVPAAAELEVARAASGCHTVAFDHCRRSVAFRRPGVEFNLGAIGKGYAVDRSIHLVRSRFGIKHALIQGGGSSLRALGTPPAEPRGWPVDLGDPCRPGRTLARVWLRDRALGTSGADHQFFVHEGRRYGHVLDPRTGVPACALLGATAMAPTALEADALSTAFFVMGLEGTRRFCAQHPATAAVLVARDPGCSGRARVHVIGNPDLEVMV